MSYSLVHHCTLTPFPECGNLTTSTAKQTTFQHITNYGWHLTFFFRDEKPRLVSTTNLTFILLISSSLPLKMSFTNRRVTSEKNQTNVLHVLASEFHHYHAQVLPLRPLTPLLSLTSGNQVPQQYFLLWELLIIKWKENGWNQPNIEVGKGEKWQ